MKSAAQMEAEWRAQQDARSLADAEAVKADAARMKAARAAAKKMLEHEQRIADELENRAKALRQLAGAGGKAKAGRKR